MKKNEWKEIPTALKESNREGGDGLKSRVMDIKPSHFIQLQF